MEPQLIAAFLGAFIAVLGAQAVWARWLIGKINEARHEAQKSDNVLHSRIGEVKDTYLRRDDFVQHMAEMKTGQDRLASSIDRLHTRMDALLNVRAEEQGRQGR